MSREGLGAGGEGDNRGWGGWVASPTRCTWVWVNSGSWWQTGRPGVLWFMGSQRVGHDWATELNWLNPSCLFILFMGFSRQEYWSGLPFISPVTSRRSNQTILKEISPFSCSVVSWVFIGRTDAEAQTPILWPPDAKNWHIGKDPSAWEDWRQEEKGTTENEMVGWH